MGSVNNSPSQSHIRQLNKRHEIMETVLVEIRAAEGGQDSKLLVEDQLKIYSKLAVQECL